jgi:hypothetical protein
MTRFRTRSLVAGAAAALLLSVGSPALAQPFPLNGNWTYQGRLTDAGVPANGIYDIQLAIYDRPAGGAALAVSFHNNVTVTNGLFTIPDVATGFLGTFQGDRRWAEVQVRPGASGGAFTVLAPRQELTATPYAMWANRAGVAGSVANHTLNNAYNSGGAGAGRTIQADSGEVAVQGASGMRVELTLRVGDIDTDGTIELYTAGANPTLVARDWFDNGGSMRFLRPDGTTITCRMEPDISGEGIFVEWYKDGNGVGMRYEGDPGTGGPNWDLLGNNSSISYRGNNTGNNSLVLPVDSVSANEILDEPGVSSSHRTGPGYAPGVITITEESSITVPVDGFLFVVANTEVVLSHTNGTVTSFTHGLNVDNSGAFPSDQDFFISLPGALPTASYTQTIGANGVFPVAAGTHTVYYLGREDSGNVSFTNDVQLSVLFVPTAYGAVDPRGGRAAGGDDATPPRDRYTITEQDIAESQAAAEELSAARLARELAEVKAQLAELRRLMNDNKPSGK